MENDYNIGGFSVPSRQHKSASAGSSAVIGFRVPTGPSASRALSAAATLTDLPSSLSAGGGGSGNASNIPQSMAMPMPHHAQAVVVGNSGGGHSNKRTPNTPLSAFPATPLGPQYPGDDGHRHSTRRHHKHVKKVDSSVQMQATIAPAHPIQLQLPPDEPHYKHNLSHKRSSRRSQKQRVKVKVKVTDKDRMQYLESFKMLDKDGDGSITSEELAGFLRSLGHVSEFEEKQLIEYVKSVDSNHNGMLEFDEFMELIVGGGSADNEEKELRETFKMFDKDGNGAIDAEEMVELMGYIGEDIDLDAAKELVQAFDSNKDGVISMDEWLSYMLPSD